jgi:hypothetical protein
MKSISFFSAGLFLTGLLSLTTMNSCYFDKEELLYPDNCDTTNISYSADIVPLLVGSCYSCHSIANAPVSGDGLILEGYANLTTYINNSGDDLVNSVKQNGLAQAMPRGAAKLNNCSIKEIEAWVLQGQLNN